MEARFLEHELEPVFDGRSRVLILGTMPSPKSREAGFYYSHPQNRFWRVLAAVLDEQIPPDNAAKSALLLKRRIALWDVLASCVIAGADDASIARPVANDIGRILRAAPIAAVFTTGAKAASLYRRLCYPDTGVAAIPLPSTSPANCRYYDLSALIAAYGVIREYL